MEAYLDNSATTRVDAQVQELMKKLMDVDFGNPSSRHQKGVVAEGYIKDARQKIAATLKVDPKELIITSGGTESNNMALIGTALAAKRKGNHIITTAVEHPSVKATASFLEEQGFRITFLSVDSRGQISLEDLKEALTPDTILVSIMYVNNEIGSVQPIGEIGELLKKQNHRILFHVDAVQAYGKFRIYPKKLGIDLMSVSSHKIHGPKGVGFLYVDSRVKILPILFGGGQQRDLRSGTENDCERSRGPGGSAPYCERQLCRRAQRGPSACAGGKGNLCIFRFCLLFQSSGLKRYAESHWSKKGAFGFHAAVQFL